MLQLFFKDGTCKLFLWYDVIHVYLYFKGNAYCICVDTYQKALHKIQHNVVYQYKTIPKTSLLQDTRLHNVSICAK